MSTEPSSFFFTSALFDDRLARVDVPDEGVGLPVIGGHRPILFDRRIGRHGQAVGLAAIIIRAILILDRDQIELAGTKPLDADIGIAVGEAAGIDRIVIRVRKAGRRCRNKLGRRRIGPVRSLEERWHAGVISGFEPGAALHGCRPREPLSSRHWARRACPSRCRATSADRS